MAEPGFMVFTMASVTSFGVRAPGMRTEPTRRSASLVAAAMLKALEARVWIRPPKRSSIWRRRKRLLSRMVTRAPMPMATLAAERPTVPAPRITT